MLTEGSYTYCVALNLKGLLDNIKIFTIFAFVFFLLRIVILIYPKYDYIVPPDAGMKSKSYVHKFPVSGFEK